MDLDRLKIRPLIRDEFDQAVEWAADEGWNPGLHDADVFWETDPGGFLGAEIDGELVATGSVVSYAGDYGFMGFFIVKPDLRGQGIGTRLWLHRRDFLKSRLRSGASIGMDGVFEMQDWYGKGGFQFSHRNLRMAGRGEPCSVGPQIVDLEDLPMGDVLDYDLRCFGCERETFLKGWLQMPRATALGFLEDGTLRGFGVIRPCREGFKIGPLFADDEEIADELFQALRAQATGADVFLDVPEAHPGAMSLAARHGMNEVFGCARMYLGGAPQVDHEKIFGITTFELG